MSSFSSLPIDQLLRPEGFPCACGKHHRTDLRVFLSGAGVLNQLPDVLRTLGAHRPFVVCDKNTNRAAGARAVSILDQAGIGHALFILPHDKVEPDEWNVGSITMAFDPKCDLLIAVGSGVINDLCKVVAHAVRVPQIVVATAPSMDGYASNSSSMHVDSVKCTLYNACPAAVIADTDILKDAPMRMCWSGLGDMLAKYVSILEWRMAHLVTGEYYCPEVAALVRRSLQKCVENAARLKERDPRVIQAVVEGLVLSGVAMSFAEISRPASGLEHYFSHLWEMMAMERGREADFHGIQVGVGTLITLKLYDWIKQIRPDREKAEAFMRGFDPRGWEAEMRRIFGETAPQIIEVERVARKNDLERHAARLERILAGWDEILGMIREELPDSAAIEALMDSLGMPKMPCDLGLSALDAMDAYTGAREIRDKYQGCNLMWDLGLADEARAQVGTIVGGSAEARRDS